MVKKKDVKLLGAVLLTKDGIRITGDLELGKDLDIDILIGMFSVVSGFVEETWGKGLDRIKLGEDYISSFPGNYTVLVVSSNGISKDLEGEIIMMLSTLENLHGHVLKEWDGLIPEQLEEDFKTYILTLMDKEGKKEKVDVAQPGFDILERKDVADSAPDIEAAFNLYFLGGYHDTAFDLAMKTSEAIDEQDPLSCMFYALGTRIFLEKRKNKESLKMLQRAYDWSESLDSKFCLALTNYAYATYYLYESDGDQCVRSIRVAKRLLDNADDVDEKSRYLHMLAFIMTEVVGYFLQDRLNEAIKRWKKLLEMIKAVPRGLSPVQKLMVVRQELLVYNNIGFATVMRDRMRLKNYKDSLPYYEKAVRLATKHNARWYSPALKANLAQSLAFTGKFRRAKKVLDESYFEAQELKSDYRIGSSECVYGVYYMQIGVQKKDTEFLYKAMLWFKKALKRQKDKAEIENINFFKKETENALKKML
jgi:tetratricopeptide (TPR) repeat protein